MAVTGKKFRGEVRTHDPPNYGLAPSYVNMSLKCMCCAFLCLHNIIVSILYDISSPFAGPVRELKRRMSAYNIRTRVQRK